MKPKLIRITTVPISLNKLLEGQLKFMTNRFKVIAVSSNKESLIKIGEKEEVDTFAIEMTRRITPIQDFIALIKLYFFFIKEKPDIVHTHTPKAGLVGILAARLAGVPNRLHTVAGLPLLETRGIKRKVLNLVERAVYFAATKVYSNSEGLKKIILDYKFTTVQKIKVLGNGSSNGIDTAYFCRRNLKDNELKDLKGKLKIKEEDFVFIFVGRLVGDKGVNELVKAFESLSYKYKNIKLLLVGELEEHLDPLEKEVKAIIEYNSNIIFAGYQDDVRLYFGVSHALAFPSYREGFPNVVMQAGAMEIPSIVTDINGCNEIVSQGLNGDIIPPKNEKALFCKMEEYVTGMVDYHGLKKNSRIEIVKKYERVEFHKILLNEYQSIL